MGRFVNRLYRIQYSFVPTHHPICPFPAIPFHAFIAAKSPPCLKGGGRGDSVNFPYPPPLPGEGRGDSVSLPWQHCADVNDCGRSQNAPTFVLFSAELPVPRPLPEFDIVFGLEHGFIFGSLLLSWPLRYYSAGRRALPFFRQSEGIRSRCIPGKAGRILRRRGCCSAEALFRGG